MADQAFQIRSISLPSKSHPAAAQIEEHLQKLRTCAASSTTWEAICGGLRVLGDVYGGIDDLLHLPCNWNRLAHPNQRKWVDEELLLSLGLLDLTAAVRDGLASAREDLQDAQMSLRRRNCCKKAQHRDSTTLRSMKKAIANSLRSVQKQVESRGKRASCSSIEAVLVETGEISLSLLKSASSFLSAGRTGTKGSRWSLVCKALHGKKVDSEEHEDGNGEKSFDALCSNIRTLESELDSLFRGMIQIRVSLLNILSF